MKKENKWRVLLTGANDGPTNMAIDEALFLLTKELKGFSGSLRFYFWKTPTISLGYFQKASEILDLDKCKGLGIDVVRRITGGGAIYHYGEITYSITSALPNPVIPEDINLSYKVLEQFLIEGIKKTGIDSKYRGHVLPVSAENFYCFVNPAKYDIVAKNKKLVGSAQRRNKKSFLQHGSILINTDDIDKMFSVFNGDFDKQAAIKEFKNNVITINDLLGREADINKTIYSFLESFKKEFNVEMLEGDLTESELKLAEKLRSKYLNV